MGADVPRHMGEVPRLAGLMVFRRRLMPRQKSEILV